MARGNTGIVAAATKHGLVFALAVTAQFALLAPPALAWDGTDTEGNAVVIESGELVRPGRDIEVYHSENGYGTYSVESIRRYGSTVEVEVFDYDKGEYQTFEMED
jgi:hypothetical protein